MGEATGSGGRGFRRECAFSDFEGRVLVIRWIDLRPGEVAEAWDFALWNLGRWLADAFKASALAEMSLSASQAGGAAIGSMEQLRAKLEDAFRSRSLVVVRAGGKVRGDSHGPSEAHRTPRETGISSDLPGSGPKKSRRGWEVSSRSGTALVAKKADLLPGEPTEEPQVAVFYIDRWLADPKEKAMLIEMYKSIHGLGDSAWGTLSILKAKIEAAFESRELVMLRQSHGGAGGGGSKTPRRHDKRDEFVQQPRRARVASAPARAVDPPTFSPKVDMAAVAATKRQAAKNGVPFCEECAKRAAVEAKEKASEPPPQPERPAIVPAKSPVAEKKAPETSPEPVKPVTAPATSPVAEKKAPAPSPEPVKPVIVLAKTAVAVKKKYVTATRQTVVLKTDKPFSGKGTFTCASGCVKFFRGTTEIAAGGGAQLDSIGSGITLEIEGVKPSALDGVSLVWKLAPGAEPVVPDADTKKMTAVEATLDLYKKDGATALSVDEKSGDGRVVHKQNTGKTLSRAKLTVKCEPADWPGTLVVERVAENIACFSAKTGGTQKTLPLEIPVGPGRTPDPLWVEGTAASASKGDSGLKLKIKDLADEADAAKITVVETKLELCDDQKALIAADKKLDPGGLLLKQDDKFRRLRAKLSVLKTPKDAPCKLTLKAAGSKVKLFGEANEKHVNGESAVVLPKEIAAGAIADQAKGMVFWAEGAGLTSLQEAVFQIDVAEVDDATDKAALTVVDLRTADDSQPAWRRLPVKTPVTEPGNHHKLQVKLAHSLGAGTYAWTSASTKFALSDQTTQTVKLTAGADASAGLDAEELKVVFTPSGKAALPAVVHKATVLKVVFAETTDNHRCGYDDMDKADNAGGQLHYVSVKKSDYTLVKTTITGGATGDMLTFKSADAAVADVVAPGATAAFDLRIDAKDKKKSETAISVWANGENHNLCAKIQVDVYKEKDLAVTVVRVHDSASPTTALQLAWDKAATETAIRSWYKRAVGTITLTDLGSVNKAYDTNANGKLDLEPGPTTSPEKTLVDAAATGTGQKVIIVRDLTWIYFLKTAAAAGTDTIALKDAYSGSMKFIGVNNEYELGTGANAETIKVKTKAGITITLHANLTKAHPTTEGLMFPLSGLSGNPIYVAEGSKTEEQVRRTIGHEVGHSLLAYKDVDSGTCLMHFSAGRTDTRLRRKELPRKYDAGNEDQWQTVAR
jgi:hypothetical protein